MSDYISQLYAERHFSPAAKADVEGMARGFIADYKTRIRNADWLSEPTKQGALRKLDAMRVKIGMPDAQESWLDDVTIRPVAEGGSFFENMMALGRARYAQGAAQLDEPVDPDDWFAPSFMVNAYYNPSANEIVFPAGVLQPPFYDPDAPREANLGAAGWLIAHEISHAFDVNGAQFDEHGNLADWWAPEDKRRYRERCAAIVRRYDGAEVAPGILTDGAKTLAENIADLGGMACALDAMRRIEHADYRAFFEAGARMFAATYPRAALEQVVQSDPHAQGRLRVNLVFQTFPEFYETYGVAEGDGMYLAPADRATLW